MHQTNDDKHKRARIKYWLDVYEISRKDLAERLSVTEASLNGWLSNKPIPPSRWEEISKMFEAPKQPVRNRVVGSTFTDEEADRIRRAAGDKSIEEYLRETLLRQADIDLGEK